MKLSCRRLNDGTVAIDLDVVCCEKIHADAIAIIVDPDNENPAFKFAK